MMTNAEGMYIGRAWFAICWFTFWGLFQAFAVLSVMSGTWVRPEAFPAGAYESLRSTFSELFLKCSARLRTPTSRRLGRGGPHPLDRFSSQLRWNPVHDSSDLGLTGTGA